MPTTEQRQKISRLTSGPAPTPAIPEVPKLPDFFKQRFPDKISEIDGYNEAWVQFFKKSGVIANR